MISVPADASRSSRDQNPVHSSAAGPNSAQNLTVPHIPPRDPIYKETKYLDNNTTLQI